MSEPNPALGCPLAACFADGYACDALGCTARYLLEQLDDGLPRALPGVHDDTLAALAEAHLIVRGRNPGVAWITAAGRKAVAKEASRPVQAGADGSGRAEGDASAASVAGNQGVTHD